MRCQSHPASRSNHTHFITLPLPACNGTQLKEVSTLSLLPNKHQSLAPLPLPYLSLFRGFANGHGRSQSSVVSGLSPAVSVPRFGQLSPASPRFLRTEKRPSQTLPRCSELPPVLSLAIALPAVREVRTFRVLWRNRSH